MAPRRCPPASILRPPSYSEPPALHLALLHLARGATIARRLCSARCSPIPSRGPTFRIPCPCVGCNLSTPIPSAGDLGAWRGTLALPLCFARLHVGMADRAGDWASWRSTRPCRRAAKSRNPTLCGWSVPRGRPQAFAAAILPARWRHRPTSRASSRFEAAPPAGGLSDTCWRRRARVRRGAKPALERRLQPPPGRSGEPALWTGGLARRPRSLSRTDHRHHHPPAGRPGARASRRRARENGRQRCAESAEGTVFWWPRHGDGSLPASCLHHQIDGYADRRYWSVFPRERHPDGFLYGAAAWTGVDRILRRAASRIRGPCAAHARPHFRPSRRGGGSLRARGSGPPAHG